MTKAEVQKLLYNEVQLNQIFDFIHGQECEIYKTDDWNKAREDDIVYIPDTDLNEIIINKVIKGYEIRNTLINLYTKRDFITVCDDNEKMAEDLFNYIDWQHPNIQDILDGYDESEANEFYQRYGCSLNEFK